MVIGFDTRKNYEVNNEKYQPSLKGTIMFNALTYVVCILLALSFVYNIWLAYVADRYENTIKKMAASYWRTYRDLAEGASKDEALDTLMRDLDHDLND